MPADADTLAQGPAFHLRAKQIDYAGNLMAGNFGVNDAGPLAFHAEGIAMANAAGLHADANMARTGFGDGALHQFQGTAGLRNLGYSHFSIDSAAESPASKKIGI